MGIVIIFFVFISILFLLIIVYYFLRKREFEFNVIGTLNRVNLVLKYVIASVFIILLIFFCIHIFDFTKNPDSLFEILLVNISFIFLICSSMVFYNSLRLIPKYVIELDYPSRTKSKRGTIKLGKIMSKNKSKHNFFLNISDLAQHMFVCGITGTGKSNLIQHFLLNFGKHHDLPFLLTEFKGEYQFLQRRIKNLLILKPGENFSIMKFNGYLILNRIFLSFLKY